MLWRLDDLRQLSLETGGKVRDVLVGEDSWAVRSLTVEAESGVSEQRPPFPPIVRTGFAGGSPGFAAPGPGPQTSGSVFEPGAEDGTGRADAKATGAGGWRERRQVEPHLHRIADLRGCPIDATDGRLGEVEDFLIEDEGWTVRYVVVRIDNRNAGKAVPLRAETCRMVATIRNGEPRLATGMKRGRIRRAPVWNGAVPLDRTYERRLHGYYGGSPCR